MPQMQDVVFQPDASGDYHHKDAHQERDWSTEEQAEEGQLETELQMELPPSYLALRPFLFHAYEAQVHKAATQNKNVVSVWIADEKVKHAWQMDNGTDDAKYLADKDAAAKARLILSNDLCMRLTRLGLELLCPKTMPGYLLVCNSKTFDDCMHYRVLGCPAYQLFSLQRIGLDTPLFLFNVTDKTIHGEFRSKEIASERLSPDAFRSSGLDLPGQIQFDTTNLHSSVDLPHEFCRDAGFLSETEVDYLRMLLNTAKADRCSVCPANGNLDTARVAQGSGNGIAASTILAMRSLSRRPPELEHLRVQSLNERLDHFLHHDRSNQNDLASRSSTPSAGKGVAEPLEDNQSGTPHRPPKTFSSPIGSSKRFECTLCNKLLSSQKQLDQHLDGRVHAEAVAMAALAGNKLQSSSKALSNLSMEGDSMTQCMQTCSDWDHEEQCKLKGKIDIPQHHVYVSDCWDPYHTSRVIDADDFQGHSMLLSDDSDANRHFCVLKAGNLSSCAHMTENALDELKARAEHSCSGDKWTRKSLLAYLRYRWIRLLEQGRVLHLFALTRKSNSYREMCDRGHSQHVVLLHTGLVDANREPLFAVLEQDLSSKGTYILLRSGIHSMVQGKLPEWWCDLLKSQNVYVNGPAYCNHQVIDSLMNATYFQGRDQRMLFDPALEVKPNSEDIVQQNLDRLIFCGVDLEEAWYRDRAQSEPQDGRDWRFLCYRGQIVRELKYEYAYNSFHFSRGNLGKRSVETLFKKWYKDSVQTAAYNFSLAVPHFHYTLISLPKDTQQRQVYVGRLQLLLPFYGDSATPKLALSIKYQDCAVPYYSSTNLLTISMAQNSARQIAVPQVPWIQVQEDRKDEDERTL